MALYFQNLDKNGIPFPMTLHSGWKMYDNEDGRLEKWALNVWIRHNNFHLTEFECERKKLITRQKKLDLEGDDDEKDDF